MFVIKFDRDEFNDEFIEWFMRRRVYYCKIGKHDEG